MASENPLRSMDTLMILRGIIHAWSERVTFDRESVDVPVPLGVLMRCADEIAQARDRGHRAVMIDPYADAAEQPAAAQEARPDRQRGAGDSRAQGAGNAAEGNRGAPAGQSVVRVPCAQGTEARLKARKR